MSLAGTGLRGLQSLGAVLLALVVSDVVAWTAQVGLGITFNAGEEFIVVMVGEVMFIVTLASIMLFAVVVFHTERAVTVAALAFVAAVVAILTGLEIATLTTAGDPAPPLQDALARDAPILIETLVPALIAAFIQWWIVRRHLRRSNRLAAAN